MLTHHDHDNCHVSSSVSSGSNWYTDLKLASYMLENNTQVATSMPC